MSYFFTILAGIVFGIIIQNFHPAVYTYLSKLWMWLVRLVKAIIAKIKNK